MLNRCCGVILYNDLLYVTANGIGKEMGSQGVIFPSRYTARGICGVLGMYNGTQYLMTYKVLLIQL